MTARRQSQPTPFAYRALARLVDRVLPLAAPLSPKLAAGDRERRRAVDRWAGWARSARDPERPLLWCHASSMGEGLQAEAVLRLIRARHPDWQIAYSFFSPSAETLARGQPADVADYLPYDTVANVERMLDALGPSALVFTKLDLWPELATRAAARGVPVALVAATVSPVSGRLRWPARALTRPGYAAVTRAGAIAEADARRLARLGTPPGRISITGDPRFDSAVRRARAVPPEAVRRIAGAGPMLVAGSTWPEDEAVLMPAFATVRAAHPNARLVVAPHEPTSRHLRRTAAAAQAAGLPAPVRLSEAAGPGPIVLVDRVGVLASAYGGATVALVGGGFGRAGLHSVLEPAAARLPVVFGPRWQSSREAGLLLDAGAAVALPRGATAAAVELARVWSHWLSDEPARDRASRAAWEVVEAGLGADARNARLIEELLAGQRPTTMPS